MMNKVNLRELILEILLEISKGERHSHLIIRGTLEKYQYLKSREEGRKMLAFTLNGGLFG